MWTLLYAGAEKEFAEWGISEDFSLTRGNQQKNTLSFTTVEDFDAGATLFEYGEPAIIYRDRDAVGLGGSIYFQGYFDSPKRSLRGHQQSVSYELHNVWWLFQNHPFQQSRKIIDHFDGETPVLVDQICAEVYLGEKGDLETRQTNGQQFQEIIDWMNECFNPTKRGASSGRNDALDIVQAGTIEPQVYIPVTRVGTILCAEAGINIFRLQPDTMIWADETTSPPTLHVRTLAKWNYATSPPTFVDYTNLPEIELHITAEQETQITLHRQDVRTLPGVIIYYWGVDEIDGRQEPYLWIDKAPADLNPYTPNISIHFIELKGGNATYKVANVVTEPMAPPTEKDWWQAFTPLLQDPNIEKDGIVLRDLIVTDDNGELVDLAAYPNILKGTALPEWASLLGYSSVRALSQISANYIRYTDDEYTMKDFIANRKMISKRITLTNAPTGQLKILASATSPELPPAGVADAIYRSTNATTHAGSITLVGDQVRSDIGIGCRLKLIGPHTTFENCVPQTITERPCFGEMQITFGPVPAANIGYLQELMKATRLRTMYRMPSMRSTGEANDALDEGSWVPADDTTQSDGGHTFDSVGYDLD